jgi:hypothetical protein
MADPAIPLMRSRRRIAFSKALDCADYRSQRILQQGFATNEMGFRVSLYGSNPERSCPLGVISGHSPTFDGCPLYPQKADIATQSGNVCFVPKADSCTASNFRRYSVTESTIAAQRLR